MDRTTAELVARCLEYPEPDTARAARDAAERVASLHPALASALWSLATALETEPPSRAEEQYTQLFDMTPVCPLHAGYHVFGDTYLRGALLSNLGVELRENGLETGGEIPDYLPLLLRLLPRLSDGDGGDLLEVLVLPALARMATALGDNRSPWAEIVRALPELLTWERPELLSPAEDRAGGFLPVDGEGVQAHA